MRHIMQPLRHLCWTVLLVPALAISILRSPSELSKTEYDFVIIGGGTAGLVLANRLSEDRSISVLVVEAGGSNEDVLASIVPFLAPRLQRTQADWNFTTAPQPALFNRTIPFARGHILGGSSSINIMGYNRASNDLWDKWANLTGDSGWSWSSVEEFYLKSSRLVKPADGHNTSGQVDPSAHGFGPVEVSVSGFKTELDDRVIVTSKSLGGRFSFTEDLNAGKFVGFSYTQSSIGNSRRSSSATAYLDPILDVRKNLEVLINSQATRLIQTGMNSSKPEYKAVEIGQDAGATRTRVTATREVILSAGAIGTPKLLLLSGIGPQDALKKIGIHPAVNLPSVGQNLTDQPLVPNYFLLNSTTTYDDILRNATLFNDTLEEWNTTGQGWFATSSSNTIAFLRLEKNASIFEQVGDPSTGVLSAHTEMLFVDGFSALSTLALPPTGHFMTALTIVVSPTSRGSLTLTSSDPFAAPHIDPAYLSTDFDIYAMVQDMKDLQTFLRSPAWSGFVLDPYGPLTNATSDDGLAAYARNFSVTVNHAVSTAAMTPVGATWGVVDPDLKVKGVEGLRVVDASIFPIIPECHPQGVVYIVAERASELIKASHGIFLT